MFMCDRTCDLFKVGNFNIKRCLLFLVCIMLLVACGENDPIESRNRHPRQQEESHSEQSGSVPAVAKEDVAAYFRFSSVGFNRLKNKLLAEYLRNRGNELATVQISAICGAMLSNNSL